MVERQSKRKQSLGGNVASIYQTYIYHIIMTVDDNGHKKSLDLSGKVEALTELMAFDMHKRSHILARSQWHRTPH